MIQNDVLVALNSLSEDVLKRYILTDELLYEIAYHLLNYEVYKNDDDGKIYLEISDRWVFNDITIEIMRDEILAEAKSWVKSYSNDIKIKYSSNLEVFQSWRSLRHICIPLTIEWILIYNTLVSEYKIEEDRFLEYINWNIED